MQADVVLAELLPPGLSDASKLLGLEPLEVVRILVAAEAVPERLVLSSELIEKVRTFGRVETWWPPGSRPVADTHPRRAWVRTAISGLLERGLVGDKTTRMDNLWRGLAVEDQEIVQQAVEMLVEEGVLTSEGTEAGLVVSITAGSEEAIKAVVSGKADSLAPLWG
jgi:hypothetical protein